MKRAIQDSNFVTIQGWMVNHLHLTSDEAIVFALICGYKDGFREPISYIAAWIGKSEDTVRRILRRLVSAKLLSEEVIPSKPTAYRVVADCKGLQNATPANCDPRKMQGVGVANCDPTHIDINNIVVDADARARESERRKQLLTKWVMDNEEGLTQVLLRAGLITSPKTTAELQAIIEPYINEYYLQIQMTGEEDIERRGRSEVKTHFARWIKKRVQAEKQELNKQNKQNNGNNSNQTSTQRVTNLEDIAKSILAGCQAGRASRQ